MLCVFGKAGSVFYVYVCLCGCAFDWDENNVMKVTVCVTVNAVIDSITVS